MKDQVISIKELQFFATQSIHVTILPNFNDTALYLLEGQYGPFRANQQVDVPFWLAINLKQKDKCNILSPPWLHPQKLSQFLDAQKKQLTLCQLPHNQFFQISYIFVKKASDNLQLPNKVKILVSDIEETRNKKINKLFQNVKGGVKINNLTSFELNKRREPMLKTLNTYQRLLKKSKQ